MAAWGRRCQNLLCPSFEWVLTYCKRAGDRTNSRPMKKLDIFTSGCQVGRAKSLLAGKSIHLSGEASRPRPRSLTRLRCAFALARVYCLVFGPSPQSRWALIHFFFFFEILPPVQERCFSYSFSVDPLVLDVLR